jgi:hypothetical protein
MLDYSPLDWFWIVGGDQSRAWSSASSAYVTEWDADRVTRITSEAELRDVLRPYGVSGPGVDGSNVDAERDRRLEKFVFAGVEYDFDVLSRGRIDKARGSALAAMIAGAEANDLRWADADHDFGWIAADNSFTLMDAPTALAFGNAAAAWEGLHIVAARNLKNMSPIPSDYASNSYWPAS